jgi:extradiol dioxygenase family protein
MKRFHVHVSVDDIDTARTFYATLFGVAPTVSEDDYAKWMLDDPKVNFAISMRGAAPGLDHLGIQVDSDDELAEISDRLAAAGVAQVAQPDAACCYAKGNKSWAADPSGVAWETFNTVGGIVTYGEDRVDTRNLPRSGSACCPTAAE